ncbi:MAG TPA: AAA family ATPase [bacterium]
MYLEHFGLREFPFSLAPDPRYLYLSAQHREALAHLLYGVQHEGGFVQLTGEVGTGKTTVCRCFLEQLPAKTRAAVVLNPGLTAAELLATICDEFEIPRPEGTPSLKTSLDLINRFLMDAHAAGERAVVVIDEAQNLDPDVLEQLRLLTNLETSRHKLLQIILMGQPELRATLARPDLRQLAQRITARFHIRPLTREETAAYVRHRLGVAGCHAELFPPEVIRRLHGLSRGVPRLINILCDRALLGAYAQGRHQVDRATLVQAAREVAGKTWQERLPLRALAFTAAGCALVVALWLAVGARQEPEPVRSLLPSPQSAPAPAPAPSVAPAPPAAPAAGSVASPAVAPATPPPAGPVAVGATTTAGSPAKSPAAPPPAAPAVVAAPAPAAAPVAPLSLQALLEQPAAEREQEAWRWLYRLWGVRAREEDGGCAQALVYGLDCLRGAGGLQQLRLLDRPAVIRVHGAAGASRWLVLERLRAGEATLAAGGARATVAAAALEGFGIRDFALLWRPPAQTGGALGTGDTGAGVAWLAQRLDAVLGAPGGSAPVEVFDAALTERVRDYQRSRNLGIDGVAGPVVLLSLDSDPGPGTPTLGTEGGGP